MSGFLLGKRPSGTGITIETQSIIGNNGGVRKHSKVKVAHIKSTFVMGIRIGSGQTITELIFDNFNVLDRADVRTTQAIETALPIPDGVPERWYGYALLEDDLPNPNNFDSHFALSPFPQTGQFQLVPFVIALTADSFARGLYMVAVSVVTSPLDGPLELRRG